VRRRLSALYNGSAGVTVATAPGAGFTVRITLPAEAA
jgi:sensor histidine kinase YesM